MAQATATSMVVGLLVAHLEETAPGTAAVLQERLDAVLEHARAKGRLDSNVLAEVASHGQSLLSTRNT